MWYRTVHHTWYVLEERRRDRSKAIEMSSTWPILAHCCLSLSLFILFLKHDSGSLTTVKDHFLWLRHSPLLSELQALSNFLRYV